MRSIPFILTLLISLIFASFANATPEQPNIILFLVDDMGWQDTSVPFADERTPFNDHYRTPSMERLAAQGIRFSNARAHAVCSPTRTSIMTGHNPARHRVTNWTLYPDKNQSGQWGRTDSPANWRLEGIQDTDITLPKLLQQAGYFTIHAGKAHWGAIGTPGSDPRNLGFDVNIAGHSAGGPGSYQGLKNFGNKEKGGHTLPWGIPGLEQYHGQDINVTDATTLEAKKAVSQAVDEGKPFYLYLAHYAVHVPLEPHKDHIKEYEGRTYNNTDIDIPKSEEQYASMVQGMDASLGDIMDHVESLGVAENTLIIFTSDNGGLSVHARGTTPMNTGKDTHNWPVRSGKGSAYEGGTRVPFIAAWSKPNINNVLQQALPLEANAISDQPTISEDLFPTILSVAKAKDKLPSNYILDGQDISPLLIQKQKNSNRPIYFHYPHVWGPKGPGYEPHSAAVYGQWKLIYFYNTQRWELYNLNKDLGEKNNLASENPKRLKRLAKTMKEDFIKMGAQWPIDRKTQQPDPIRLPEEITLGKRPNIVVIFADDLGYRDLGTYGAEGYTTPHLDRLAKEGMRFTDFYSCSPVCSPSRAGLLTGSYPIRVGVPNVLGPKSTIGLNPKEFSMAKMLKTQGYNTACYGKWHLGHQKELLPMQQGFDDYFGLPYSNDMWPHHPTGGSKYPPLPLLDKNNVIATNPDQTQLTTWYTERAVNFINQQDHSTPFFVYLPHSMPHVPLFVSDKFNGKSKNGIYGDVIMEIDWSVGQIVKALKRKGFGENTIVIFSSDNGPWLSYGDHAGSALPLREGKATTFDGGQRVPCIAWWPKTIPAGSVNTEFAAMFDWLPTFAHVSGAALPDNHILDGKNISSLLTNPHETPTPHDAYFFTLGRTVQAVRSGDFKYHDKHSYRTLISDGKGGYPGEYDRKASVGPALFNLKDDIGETKNLIDQHPEIANALQTRIDEFRIDLQENSRPPGTVSTP